MMEKSVDVIIPTYKPDDSFAQLIKRLQQQNYPIARILVMNTEEEYWDPMYERLVDNMEVRHLSRQQFDHGGTRDQAVRLSNADVVVCMTQDACPQDRDLIGNLVKHFDQSQVAAVYGRQLPRTDCDTIERYTRVFNYPPKSQTKQREDIPKLGIKTYFCSNVCAAYDRSVYQELGGFITHTIFNEDMIFAATVINAGYNIVYAADARVIHSHNYGNVQQIKRNFDMAVSQADHPEVFAGLKAEGEGMRLVKQTAAYLIKQRKPWLIVSLIMRSACKYLGYLLGKNYHRLPQRLIQKLTMNPAYWQ